MSMRFSIFTQVTAFVVVVAMCTVFMLEAQAYHCDDEEEKFWDEFWDLVEKGTYMSVLCSPPSLSTGWGVAACAAATLSFFRQAADTRKANMAWDACKAEHGP